MILQALLLATALHAAADPEKPLVFIDPGHGGAESGVKAAGLEEASLTLDMGRELAKQLKELKVASQLSRDSNSESPVPSERARRANASGAKVFVALHVNHAPSPSVHGARIFIPKPVAGDSAAIRAGQAPLAWKEGAGAWADESRRIAMECSASMAPSLASKPPVQSLQLAAFKGLAMPALFIEIGFASHAESLERLKDAAWRGAAMQKLAEALAKSVAADKAAFPAQTPVAP